MAGLVTTENIQSFGWTPGTRCSQRSESRRIGEMLLDACLVTAAEISEAVNRQAIQGGKIVESLIHLGYLNAHTFVKFLASQPGIASIDLRNYTLSRGMTQWVPQDFAIERQVFPIDKLGRMLTLAMVCPLDSKTIHELEGMTALRVKPMLCKPDDIAMAIERFYGDGAILSKERLFGNASYPNAVNS
jgi:type IV pilus assembly protein PilB